MNTILKAKFSKVLALLLMFAMVFAVLPIIPAEAAAAPSVVMQLVDKDGSANNIATWTYDDENETYIDNATSQELSIVTDYSSNPLVYTGINKKPDPRCLSVTTKGIALEDLYDYAQNLAGGINLRGDTAMYLGNDTGFGSEFTYDQYWGLDRYNYMNWYNASSYTSDATIFNDGVAVEGTLAIKGYHATTDSDVGTLISQADSENALRISLGQQENGNKNITDSWVHSGNNGGAGDVNEGNLSVKNISSIKFTPNYKSITVNGGTAEGTEGSDGYAVKTSDVTVKTDDNWFKAAGNEKVYLTITADSCNIEKVSVNKKSNNEEIQTTYENGKYSFVMPDEEVTVSVTTSQNTGSDVDDSWYNAEKDSFVINNAAELAGLASLVNGGTDFTGKTVTLGGNIILNDKSNWTAIGDATHAFNGTFDGAGYEISGLYINDATGGYKGLFGNSTGTVKNFNISGTIGTSEAYIKAGSDNIGGAVGYNGGTVTNVISNVSVYVDTSAIYAVGGVVGQNGDDAVIKQCGNVANVEGTKCVGGVVGRSYGTIEECYNTGNITGNGGGKDGIGGIVGIAGDKSATYDNYVYRCYNTGTISNNGGRWHGGIAGMADNAATVKYCYDTGVVSAGYSWNWNPIVGHVDSALATISNNYSLEGLSAGDSTSTTMPCTIGTVKTADEMKNVEFLQLLNVEGEAFVADSKSINNGYPILSFQVEGDDEDVIGTVSFVDADTYNAAPAGYKVVKFVPTDAAANVKYQYDGKDMIKSEKYNCYLYFAAEATTEEVALEAITATTGTNPVLAYDGDVNGDGKIQIDDAQLIYDLYSNWEGYSSDTSFNKVSVLNRLEADVNGDGVVDLNDAQAVITVIMEQ